MPAQEYEVASWEVHDREAYQFFRDEIKREDELTERRFSSYLALQGFMVASIGIIISNGITEQTPNWEDLVNLRRVTFPLVAAVGVTSSIFALKGIRAAHNSVTNVIQKRDQDISQGLIRDIPGYPPAHGSVEEMKNGRAYPVAIISIIGVFWLLIFCSFLAITVFGIRPWPLPTPSKKEPTVNIAISASSRSGLDGNRYATKQSFVVAVPDKKKPQVVSLVRRKFRRGHRIQRSNAAVPSLAGTSKLECPPLSPRSE